MLTPFLPILVKCPLFAGLDEAGILNLIPCFDPILFDSQKGDILCQAGEPQQTIGIVLAGEIQIQKEDYTGNRLIIGIFGPGELFGEVSAYAGPGRWPNTVVAGKSGQILQLPIEKISQPCFRTCDFHQRLIRNMLGIVAGKAMMMNSRLGYLQLRGMRQKLAAWLFEQYRQTGNRTFLAAMNREELADYLNVSRPSMSRELGRMKDEGIIDYFRSSFTIKDLEALRAN
jgi:CRP-like cAMP-binding protein